MLIQQKNFVVLSISLFFYNQQQNFRSITKQFQRDNKIFLIISNPLFHLNIYSFSLKSVMTLIHFLKGSDEKLSIIISIIKEIDDVFLIKELKIANRLLELYF